MQHDSVFGNPSLFLRQILQHKHERLKKVQIIGFCSAKSMVELTCHILENATSLECLTLDTTPASYRCSGDILDRQCPPLETESIRDAHKSLLDVRTYIDGKVPSTVKLNVPEPCGRCHRLKKSDAKSV